jgi:hypothetical protein
MSHSSCEIVIPPPTELVVPKGLEPVGPAVEARSYPAKVRLDRIAHSIKTVMESFRDDEGPRHVRIVRLLRSAAAHVQVAL